MDLPFHFARPAPTKSARHFPRFSRSGPVLALLFVSTVAGLCGSELEQTVTFEPVSRQTAYRILDQQVQCLNHNFYPIGTHIHEYASVRHTDKALLRLDERVQHVNALAILREKCPEEIQSEINQANRQLRRVRGCQQRSGRPESIADRFHRSAGRLNFWRIWTRPKNGAQR
jgi:hypothetical protein